MDKDIQNVIRRIQKEAKKKVEAARYSKSNLSHKVAPVSPSLDVIVASVRGQLATALTQALSNKAARQYIGDITDELQHVATDVIRSSSSYGGTFQEGKNIVIYPNNCKLLVQDNEKRGCVIIEESPQYRTVFSRHTGKTKPYRISLPYVVYIISFFQDKQGIYHIDRSGIGFGKKPIHSIDCRLYLPALPHTSRNTSVCQPTVVENHKNIKDLAESFVNTFWSSVFHYTFEQSRCEFKVKGEKILEFEDWEKIKNPLDILKGDFNEGETIRELIHSVCNVRNSSSKSENNLVKNVVSRVVNGINSNLSAQDLSDVIRKTSEEIVDAALKNIISESALQ